MGASSGKDIHLILFFTQDVSLQTWEQVGMFEREVALYQRLQKHGVRVSFITYGDSGDLRFVDRIPGIDILCNRWRLPLHLYKRLLPYLHARHLWRADIYKSNQIKGADMALRNAQQFHKPLIARCGWLLSFFASWEHGTDSEAFRFAKEREARVFIDASRVVVTTEPMRQHVSEQYGLTNSKVRVIPNYVLTDLFRPESGNNCKSGCICFVGRLEAQKNLFALLEAIRGLNVELEIIGDGSYRKRLEVTARDYKVNVSFLGTRPHTELPQHFNSAEIVILPSLYEGHPKTLLEAMACGRPVVATNVPGIRELIHHRETGYLCGTSPKEIRSAIQDVLADSTMQERLGRQARNYVLDNYSLDHVLEMELSLLKELGK